MCVHFLSAHWQWTLVAKSTMLIPPRVRMPPLLCRRTRLYTEPMSALLEEYWDFLHVSAGGMGAG